VQGARGRVTRTDYPAWYRPALPFGETILENAVKYQEQANAHILDVRRSMLRRFVLPVPHAAQHKASPVRLDFMVSSSLLAIELERAQADANRRAKDLPEMRIRATPDLSFGGQAGAAVEVSQKWARGFLRS
jgi:hypothetical protein